MSLVTKFGSLKKDLSNFIKVRSIQIDYEKDYKLEFTKDGKNFSIFLMKCDRNNIVSAIDLAIESAITKLSRQEYTEEWREYDKGRLNPTVRGFLGDKYKTVLRLGSDMPAGMFLLSNDGQQLFSTDFFNMFNGQELSINSDGFSIETNKLLIALNSNLPYNNNGSYFTEGYLTDAVDYKITERYIEDKELFKKLREDFGDSPKLYDYIMKSISRGKFAPLNIVPLSNVPVNKYNTGKVAYKIKEFDDETGSGTQAEMQDIASKIIADYEIYLAPSDSDKIVFYANIGQQRRGSHVLYKYEKIIGETNSFSGMLRFIMKLYEQSPEYTYVVLHSNTKYGVVYNSLSRTQFYATYFNIVGDNEVPESFVGALDSSIFTRYINIKSDEENNTASSIMAVSGSQFGSSDPDTDAERIDFDIDTNSFSIAKKQALEVVRPAFVGHWYKTTFKVEQQIQDRFTICQVVNVSKADDASNNCLFDCLRVFINERQERKDGKLISKAPGAIQARKYLGVPSKDKVELSQTNINKLAVLYGCNIKIVTGEVYYEESDDTGLEGDIVAKVGDDKPWCYLYEEAGHMYILDWTLRIKHSNILYWDTETIVNCDGELQVDMVQFKLESDADVTVFEGFDCMHKFKLVLEEYREMHFKLVCVAYNSAKFDSILALKYFGQSVNTVFETDNKIRNFTMFGHTFIDFKFFIDGSLADGCDAFKVPIKKQKNIVCTHQYRQAIYDRVATMPEFAGNLLKIEDAFIAAFQTDTIAYEEFLSYSKTDVLALQGLCEAYTNKMNEVISLNEIFSAAKIRFDLKNLKIGSISSFGYNLFKNTTTVMPTPLPTEYDKIVREHAVAGRTDTLDSDCKTESLVERALCFVDVSSLYPSQAFNNDANSHIFDFAFEDLPDDSILKQSRKIMYPTTGEIEDVDSFDIHRVGHYLCEIDQSNLRTKIVAKKNANVNLDWNCDVLTTWITHIEYLVLRKYAKSVTIVKGFVYKTQSDTLFDNYMKTLYMLKHEQDRLKEAGSSAYNPALRQIIKSLINNLIGKFMERLYDSARDYLSKALSRTKLDDAIAKLESKLEPNNMKTTPRGAFIIVEGKLLKAPEPNKACYIAAFNWSYSRMYMYTAILNPYKLRDDANYLTYYTDTDSCCMSIDNSAKMYDCNPTLRPTAGYDGLRVPKIGELDIEFSSDKTHFQAIAKKFYLAIPNNSSSLELVKAKNIKCKVKGISLGDSYFIDYRVNSSLTRHMLIYKNAEEQLTDVQIADRLKSIKILKAREVDDVRTDVQIIVKNTYRSSGTIDPALRKCKVGDMYDAKVCKQLFSDKVKFGCVAMINGQLKKGCKDAYISQTYMIKVI